MTHIYEVYCPSCGRMWTGEFSVTTVKKAVCKDCIQHSEGDAHESPDIHLNPYAKR